MNKIKLFFVFGTRPECIKMAPVVLEAQKHPDQFEVIVCVTAQHREMLDQSLELFGITPQYDLNIMSQKQSLEDITSKILLNLGEILEKEKPDYTLVHGDTSTTFTASLSSFYHHTKVAHVEAGLRTDNLLSPWPEEANRRLTSVLTHYHFAPTQQAKENLLKENTAADSIHITGNTVIDALFFVVDKMNTDQALKNKLAEQFHFLNPKKKMILVTTHRRENSGRGFENICESILETAEAHDDIEFVFPVHKSPRVREVVYSYLKDKENIHLIEPQDYLSFVYLMDQSYLILTDSGGVQEEAPSLGKPVLVLRDTTERPEAVEAGTVQLVGTEKENILKELHSLLSSENAYKAMSQASNPYGNGASSQAILDVFTTHG